MDTHEQRFAAIFSTCSEGIIIQDENGRIEMSNAGAERLLGFPCASQLRVPWLETQWRAIHEDGSPFPAETHPAAIASETGLSPSGVIMGVYHPDGALRWISVNSLAIPRASKPHAVVTTFTGVTTQNTALGSRSGITANQPAEEALQRSEARFRALVETSNDGFIFGDAEGVILYRSPSYRLFTGYSDEERLGHSGFELVHPDDLARVRQAWKTVISQSEPVREVLYRLRHKDGGWRWIEGSGHNFLADPDVGAILWIDRDITEHKQAEDALRQSEAKFRAIVENSHDGIIFNDANGVILYRSPSYHRIIGYADDERVGHSAFGLLHPDDVAAARRAWARVLHSSSGTMPFGAYRLRHKDGTWRWVEAWAQNLLDNPNVQAVVVASRDITERKQSEEQRDRLQAQLAQAQKMESIGRLAGGVAHDFNNLLTIINGYSKLALTELSPGDPLREQLEEIYKAGERAAGLTQQLLAFSRKQILQLRVLDLNRVVESMQSMLGRLVGEDVQLRFQLSTESPIVRADQHQLEQVLMNLAANARDAMPGGGRLLIETGLVGLDGSDLDFTAEAPPGRYALLAVSDTGIGMDESTRQRIFEPFFTSKGLGTGLGLSTVQGIVAQCAGFIKVDSAPERGTTFKIYLPAPSDAKITEKPAAVPVPALRGRETILVVEDQAEVRQYAVASLQSYGYRVLEAAHASDALTTFEKEGAQIDLLLTDVVMPDMNGWELVQRLREARAGLKVLFMSGYADTASAFPQVLDEGTQFIEKPFTPEKLAVKTRDALGPPAASARILIIDDEASVRSLLRAVLEQNGHQVIEAAEGQHIRTLQTKVDLVIVGLLVPEQEGMQSIEALRRELPGVGIIVMSGALTDHFQREAKALGADVVLEKPVSPESLLACVTEVLLRR